MHLCVTFSCCHRCRRYFYDFYSTDIFTVLPLPPPFFALLCVCVSFCHIVFMFYLARLWRALHIRDASLCSALPCSLSLLSSSLSTLCGSLWRCSRSYFMRFHWQYCRLLPHPSLSLSSFLPLSACFNYLSLGQPLSILKRWQFCFPFGRLFISSAINHGFLG